MASYVDRHSDLEAVVGDRITDERRRLRPVQERDDRAAFDIDDMVPEEIRALARHRSPASHLDPNSHEKAPVT